MRPVAAQPIAPETGGESQVRPPADRSVEAPRPEADPAPDVVPAPPPEPGVSPDPAPTVAPPAPQPEASALPTPVAPRPADEPSEAELLAQLSLEELLSLPLRTGSFLSLDVMRTPASITIIDHRQISLSGARDLDEVLEIFVPGLQHMVNKWNGDVWGLRGTSPNRNTKIIVLVNGLKLNSQSRDGYVAATSLGLLDDIERIEVLRGPAGLTYGSGAISGVVNVVTRRPGQTSGNVRLSAGSWKSVGVEALAHLRSSASQSLTVSAGARYSTGTDSRIFGGVSWPNDGVAHPDGFPANDHAWRSPINTRASLDWQYERLRIYTRFTQSRAPMGSYFSYDPWPEVVGSPSAAGLTGTRTVGRNVYPADSAAAAALESFGNNRRLHVRNTLSTHATYSVDVDEDTLQLDLGMLRADNRVEFYWRPGYDPKSSAINQTHGEWQHTAGAQYTIRRLSWLESAVGLQYRLDKFGNDFLGMNITQEDSRVPDVAPMTYHNFALFAENYLTASDWLAFDVGARIDKHTRTKWLLNPKVAAIVTANEDNSLRAIFQTASNNGSEASYEPTFENAPHLEYPSDPTSDRIPGITKSFTHRLKPERTYAYELTTTHRVLRDIVLNPSVAYSRIENLFAWSDPIGREYNSGKYTFLNAELSTMYDHARLQIGASHVYQRPLSASRKSVSIDVPKTQIVPRGTIDGVRQYGLEPVPGTDQFELNGIRDQVSLDGKNFLSLATHSTKVFATYAPLSWLTLHSNVRIFWGLPGRKPLNAKYAAPGENDLGIVDRPIARWNVSARVELSRVFVLGLHGNDLLGTERNRHAVTWQQVSLPGDRDLYTLHQRSFFATLEASY